MFKIEIKTDGAAFTDPFTGDRDPIAMEAELLRIIKEQVEWYLLTGITDRNLRDINGNTVGRMEVIE